MASNHADTVKRALWSVSSVFTSKDLFCNPLECILSPICQEFDVLALSIQIRCPDVTASLFFFFFFGVGEGVVSCSTINTHRKRKHFSTISKLSSFDAVCRLDGKNENF